MANAFVNAVKNGPFSGVTDAVYGKDQTGTFKPPTLDQGKPITSTYQSTAEYKPTATYDPTAYTGQFDASGGGAQVNNLESALGVQKFDPNQFRGAQGAAIDANVAQQVAASKRINDQNALNSGLGNSGMNRALGQLAQSEGDRTGILAKAALEGQIAGLQQNENQFRTGAGLQAAGQTLQNQQFGANLGENQAQFGANFKEGQNQFGANFQEGQNQFAANNALQAAGLNEGQRQFNEQAKYGSAQDTYLSGVAKQQRKDQRTGALIQAGTGLASGLASAAGPILGAAALA